MNARLTATILFFFAFYLTGIYAADQGAPMEQAAWNLFINTVSHKHGKAWEKNFTSIYPNPTPTGLLELAQLCDKFEECEASKNCNKPHMLVTVYKPHGIMGAFCVSQPISDPKAISILKMYVESKAKKN